MIKTQWLGKISYGETLLLQREYRDQVIKGTKPPIFWLLEHYPVVTEGRRSSQHSPIPILAEKGIEWYKTERGGLATYHGPGQLVGYLITNIKSHNHTIKSFVNAVEQGLIDYLSPRVDAQRRPEYPGVWVNNNKIAAVGFHIKEGVSMHGFALNLTVDLAPYYLITPCGITDGWVTSLKILTENSPEPEECWENVANSILQSLLIKPNI